MAFLHGNEKFCNLACIEMRNRLYCLDIISNFMVTLSSMLPHAFDL